MAESINQEVEPVPACSYWSQWGLNQALLPTQLTWEASGFALGSKILSCLSWKSKEEATRVQLGWAGSLGASLTPGSH